MLYNILHIPAKIAFYFWCRKLKINNKAILNVNGPLLIAANHPNSFLDAILLCSIFKQPIYSLARGDAFKHPLVNKIFHSLKMFPVYRVSEGVENLEENYKTFDDCINIFKKNGIVLIFSEGKCINEWNLRPLKKGTARLAMSAWEQGIPLKVLPLGINYSSFTSFGKNIILNFGTPIEKDILSNGVDDSFGNKVSVINNNLLQQLKQLVITIKPANASLIKEKFEVKIYTFKKIFLMIPSAIGFVLHAPLYFPLKKWVSKKFSGNDHYDSVIMGSLFLSYPIYLILIFLILLFCNTGLYALLVFALFPFFAWSYLQLKKQF